MFTILKPTHPDEVTTRERLRDIVDGALHKAWGAWSDACDRTGLGDDQFDDFYLEVASHIYDLAGLIDMGRPDRHVDLEDLATGEIVPVFDADGNPVIRDGQQMYATKGHAEWLDETAAEIADWLKHNAADQATLDYLRAADCLRAIRAADADPPLPPDEVDYIASQAATILRGEV